MSFKRSNVFILLSLSFLSILLSQAAVSEVLKIPQALSIPDNSRITYELPDSSVYEGPIASGLFQGAGKLTWRNGNVYEGAFDKGRMSGVAKLTSNTGDVYEGEFLNGLEQGIGKWNGSNGEYYTGEFLNGLFHGKGEYLTFDGDLYQSNFFEGKATGFGTVTLSSGDHYIGDIQNWRFHGQGKYEIFGKETYEGGFSNNSFHGKGQLSHVDGSNYTGNFHMGSFDGNGVYKDSRGRIYRGQFTKGQQAGPGMIEYENGDHYAGAIDDWLPHGFGTYSKGSGVQYVGEFVNNLYEGKGKITYKNGDRFEGNFKSGRYHGIGKFIYKEPMGKKQSYEGEWDNGKLLVVNGEPVKNSKNKRDKYFVEESLIKQHPLLTSTLNRIAPGIPNQPELYFLSFGGYGGQDVFMKEALYSEKLFKSQFETDGKSMVLINNRKTNDEIPMATVGNLKRTLRFIGQQMNVDEDILFLFLTSHGSKKYGLSVKLGGIYLHDLKSPELADMLKESGIKWKVIVVSACYSGTFIDDLADEYTMIMTASKPDHVSFGCSDETDFTFFGRAYFEKSVSESKTFKIAFEKAKKLIYKWEEEGGYSHSEPQFSSSGEIEQQLKQWRNVTSKKRIALSGAE
ncbi:MAG: hypothetical protein COB30_009855 [Ectothiorhodospiraceae bacterium]|nr:hypothetical protein [Ectothiorhodospiraceae bacterium]